MVIVGDVLVTKIMEKVIDVGFSYLADQYRWHSGGMKDVLQRLMVALPLIQAVVAAADNAWTLEQQTANPHLQAWLQQFKDAVYEADDALGELEYLRLQKQVEADDNKRDEDHNKVRHWFSNSKQSIIKFGKPFFKLDTTLKNLRRTVKRLDEVAAHVGDFLALVSSSGQQSHHQQRQSCRETGSLVTETIVFGRDKEREELLQWLMKGQPVLDEKNNVSIYSVVGLGGFGKTTLVQLVYNDENVQNSFDLKMWVCVSTRFDVRWITAAMLESATKKRSEIDNLATLQDALKDKLMSSSKFLLVLDDVWDDQKNCSDWNKLLAPLRHGHKGSKILLTTRMDKVAKEAMRAMDGTTTEYLKLNPIHRDDFFSLFSRYAFAGISSDDYKELQPLGTKIAKRLGGSPLAAKTIGALLNSNLDERYWRSILNSKNISDQGQQREGNIMSILMLSYHHLPLYLRPCFAFCSTFPQDYEFDKEDLVLKWMALGLIQHSPQNQGRTLEDIGSYYFDELFNRSFFEQKKIYNSKWYYSMHDLLHDVARTVSHGECFSIVNDDKSVGYIPNTVRHLYLATDNPNIVMKVDKWQQLRSLQLIIISSSVRPELVEVVEKVIKSLKCVRMLEVCVYGMGVLPDVFGHLRHLRSLTIRKGIDEFPASLSKLHNLQVLKLTIKDSTAALPILLPNKRSSRSYFVNLSQYNRLRNLSNRGSESSDSLSSRGSESSDSFRAELSETVTSFPNPTTHQDSPFLYHFDEISCAIRDPLSEHLSSSSWICTLREQKAIVFRRRLLDGEILQSALSSISGIRHPSLARLLGAALNGDHIFIIYECIADSATLKQYLNSSSFSNWVLRLQVALDVSMGLEYIHRDCDTVHAMISSSSIIVTEPNFNAKIVLFGAASDPATSADEDVEMRAKRLAGDLFSIEEPTGYVAPEVLAGGGRMSRESDVFALGMLILELVSGKIPLEYRMNKISLKCERISVIETAKHAVGSDGDKLETEERKRRIRMWVDQKLVNPFPDGVAEELIRLGLLCVKEDPSMRAEVASVTETIVKHLAPFLPSHPTWWRRARYGTY